MMKKLVIIPAYNECGSILKAVDDIKMHAPDFDYVVINDCSTDETLDICRRYGLNHVNLSVNLGIGGAVQTGYIYACQYGYDVAVQFDGDGQHDAAYLEDMAQKLSETGSDMVIGSRFIEKEGFQSSGIRRVGIRYFSALIRLLTGKRVTDPTSGMRMFNGRMIGEFALKLNYGPEPDTVSYLIKQGARVAEIPVVIGERLGGESYLKPAVAAKYMMRMLLSILLVQNFRSRSDMHGNDLDRL